MLNLARDGFTREQVMLALHSPNRRLDFRFELLDKESKKKKNLTTVISGDVNHNSLATIKRTANFTLKDDPDINYLSDKIKPYVRVFVPEGKILARYYNFYSQQFAAEIEVVKTSENSGWAEFPLGEFLLSSPTKKEENGIVIREIEAFDGLVILNEDKFTERYGFGEGTSYYQAIITLLQSAGINKYNIGHTDKTLPRDIEFEMGTSKLQVINELLAAINFEPIHVDVNGFFISQAYRSPSLKTPEYYYVTNSESVTFGGMSEELDVFDVPNKWVVVVSNAEQEPLISTYENHSESSPTSIENRGRTIVDFREVDDIADQESLDAYVDKIAFEASQVFGKVEFETAIMPFHDYNDVFEIDFTDLGVKGLYSETEWSFPFEVGGRMKHRVRRVVNI